MKIRVLFLSMLLCFFGMLGYVQAQNSTMFYAGGDGNEAFRDVFELEDGTLLVAGSTTDKAWLDGLPGFHKELDGSGVIIKGTNNYPDSYGFLLRLSADMQTVLGVFSMPKGVSGEVRFIKTNGIPGESVKSIYFSGDCKCANSGTRNGGYYIAKLNNTAFDASTDIERVYIAETSIGNSKWSKVYHQNYHSWDVASDGTIFYGYGDDLFEKWVEIRKYNPDGTFGRFSDRMPEQFVIKMFGSTNEGAKRNFRSMSTAEYVETPDANGGKTFGSQPLDMFIDKTKIDPNGYFLNNAQSGPTGFNMSKRFGGLHNMGVLSIAIDRKTGLMYSAIIGVCNEPGGGARTMPFVYVSDTAGNYKWWTRMLHEIEPGGDKISESKNIEIQGMAIDYANNQLVVVATSHGKTVDDNFFDGKSIFNQSSIDGFQHKITGAIDDQEISWVGKFGLDNGKLLHASYVGAADPNYSSSTKLSHPLYEGWDDINASNPDLKSTTVSPNQVKVARDGAVYFVGKASGRLITSSNAFQLNPKFGSGNVPAEGAFVRSYSADLSIPIYSSVIAAGSKTAPQSAPIDLNGVYKTKSGFVVVGTQPGSSLAVPVNNVPSWGVSTPVNGKSYSLIGLLKPECHTEANFYTSACSVGTLNGYNTSTTISSSATYAWTIKDNGTQATLHTSTDRNLKFFPSSVQNVDIELIVTDATGSCKDTAVRKGITTPGQLQVGFKTDSFPYANEMAVFRDTSKYDRGTLGTTYEVVWDFGDGTMRTYALPQDTVMHKYTKTGDVTVKMTYRPKATPNTCTEVVTKNYTIRVKPDIIGKNIVTYLTGSGADKLYETFKLSDGTYLIGGNTTDTSWFANAGVRKKLDGSGINRLSNSRIGTENTAFLARVSKDFSQLLGVFYIDGGRSDGIKSIKSTATPGTGSNGIIYMAGNCDAERNGSHNGTYFIAKLNNSSFDASTDIEWANHIKVSYEHGKDKNRFPITYHYNFLPWDVASDGSVVYIYGDDLSNKWVEMRKFNPDGSAAAFTGNTLFGAGMVLKMHGTTGENSKKLFRSLVSADFVLQPDANGGLNSGKHPFDMYHDGSMINKDGFAMSDQSRGVTGWYYRRRFSFIQTMGVSSIAVDRRSKTIYAAVVTFASHGSNGTRKHPFIYAMDFEGNMKWWMRVHHEIAPNGDTIKNFSEHEITGLEIDYSEPESEGRLVIQAKTDAGTNFDMMLFEGNKISGKPELFGFQNRPTGSASATVSWLGKVDATNGQLLHCTYVAEYAIGATQGAAHSDPNLDGWGDPNNGNPDVGLTEGRFNKLKVSPTDGAVTVIGTALAAPITTKNAFQKQPKGDNAGYTRNFVRVYSNDLKVPVFSSLTQAGTKTAPVRADMEIHSVVNTGTGFALVGFQTGTTDPTVPTENVPSWGSSALSGNSSGIVMYIEPSDADCKVTAGATYSTACDGKTTLYNTSTSLNGVLSSTWTITGPGLNLTDVAPNLRGKHYQLSFPQAGDYKVKVKSSDSRGCSAESSEMTVTVKSTQPLTADIDTMGTIIAGGNSVFKNTSKGTDGTESYSWDLNGDGKADTLTRSLSATVNYVYGCSETSAKVKMKIITNRVGCRDTVEKTYPVSPVSGKGVDFSASETTVYPGQQVTYSNTSDFGTTAATYEWFVDGVSKGSASSISMKYSCDSTKGVVRLKADLGGSGSKCYNATDTTRTYTFEPALSISLDTVRGAKCGGSLTFTPKVNENGMDTTVPQTLTINGADSAVKAYEFKESGDYTVVYSATTTHGCSASITKTGTVIGNVKISITQPSNTCSPVAILVTINAKDTVKSITFVFGSNTQVFDGLVLVGDTTATYDVSFDMNGNYDVSAKAYPGTSKECEQVSNVVNFDVTPNLKAGVHQVASQLSGTNNKNVDAGDLSFQWLSAAVSSGVVDTKEIKAVSENLGGKRQVFHAPVVEDIAYAVQVSQKECIDTSSFVIFGDGGVNGLDDAALLSGLSLYPNPFGNELNLSLENGIYVTVSINVYNATGQLVLSGSGEKFGEEFSTNLNTVTLPSGLYIVEVSLGDHKVALKATKE